MREKFDAAPECGKVGRSGSLILNNGTGRDWESSLSGPESQRKVESNGKDSGFYCNL